MPKRMVYIALGLFLAISLLIVLLVNLTKKEGLTSPVSEKKQEAVEADLEISDNLKEYIDPSGFKFKYPDNFSLSSADQTSENIYSSLTLGSDKVASQTTILVEATSAKSLDDWLLNNKESLSNQKLRKIKLADLDARQYQKDNKVITVAYDTGVLLTITTELKPVKETMLQLHETILTTFAFAPPQSTDESSSQSSGAEEEQIYFEGEEIIE